MRLPFDVVVTYPSGACVSVGRWTEADGYSLDVGLPEGDTESERFARDVAAALAQLKPGRAPEVVSCAVSTRPREWVWCMSCGHCFWQSLAEPPCPECGGPSAGMRNTERPRRLDALAGEGGVRLTNVMSGGFVVPAGALDASGERARLRDEVARRRAMDAAIDQAVVPCAVVEEVGADLTGVREVLTGMTVLKAERVTVLKDGDLSVGSAHQGLDGRWQGKVGGEWGPAGSRAQAESWMLWAVGRGRR